MRITQIRARTDRLLAGIDILQHNTYYGTAVGTILAARTDEPTNDAESRRYVQATNRIMTGHWDPRPLWL